MVTLAKVCISRPAMYSSLASSYGHFKSLVLYITDQRMDVAEVFDSGCEI